MANDAKSDPADWAAAMQKAQGELMRQWSDMAAVWAGKPADGAAAASAMPGNDIARRLTAQFEQYLGISRELWDLVGKAAVATDAEQRVRLFNEGLSAMQQQFAGLWGANPFAAMPSAFTGPFGMPAAPPNPFAAFGFGAPAAPAFAPPPLDWPALGPSREQQESWQRAARIAARFVQAQMKLTAQWNQIIADGLRELGTRMTPQLQSGAMPGSMKEVYDLWVDSAEKVYARAAHGAAFMQAQAELTNAASEMRIAQRELLEEWARQFDLPTRAELNTLHQQIRELKAALQKLGAR